MESLDIRQLPAIIGPNFVEGADVAKRGWLRLGLRPAWEIDMKAGLTKVQRAVLDAIQELTVNGIAPTYDELAAHLGMRSRGQVSQHLTRLREKGWIEFGPKRRSIRVIEDGQPSEADIQAASTVKLRAVIDDAADALAAQIGNAATADVLALVLENRRKMARAENGGVPSSPRRRPYRFPRKSD